MGVRERFESKNKNKSVNSTPAAKFSVRERYEKKKAKNSLETTINFDTFESDLNSLGTTIQNIYNGWQTEETMKNTRSSIEAMQSRISAYQEYQKVFGGANLSDVADSYKNVLDEWDSLTSHYGQYKDVDSYTKEKTKLSELDAMTIEDLEPYTKDKNNKIAYTTVGGQDITWQSLYDSKKHNKMASSKEGVEGWKKYVSDEEASTKKAQEEKANEPWWETLIGYLGQTSPDATLPMATTTQVIENKRNDNSYARPKDNWTEQEKNIFGAYYLENPQSAYDYATKLNNQKAREEKNKGKEAVGDSATSSFWSGLGQTGAAILTAPLGIADYLDDLTDIAAGRGTIVEEGGLTPFEYSQAVTGGISSHLNEMSGTLDEDIAIFGGKGLGDIYGLGTSILQSAASAYTLGGGGTLISYFGQGAAAGVDDALSRGATSEQALIYGTIVGAAEGISEQIGVEKLLKIGASRTIKQAFKNIFKQGISEGVEEGVSSLIGNIADNIALGENSNFNKAVRQLKANGLSDEEAKTKAWLDTVGDMVYDFVGGFVSGGVHAGPQTAIATHKANVRDTAIGQNVRSNERVNDLLGMAQMTPRESEAYELYTDYAVRNNRENISDKQLGQIYSSLYEGAQNTVESKKSTVEQKESAKKTLGDLSAYSQETSVKKLGKKNIESLYGADNAEGIIAEGLESGKDTESYKLASEYKAKVEKGEKLTTEEITNLVDANQSAYKEEVKVEAKAKLSNLGENVKDNNLAEIIAKKSVGEQLTSKEAEILENSEYGNRVYHEINNEEAVDYTKNMDKAEADLFLSVYDGKTNIDAFANSFNLVNGYANNKFTQDYILEHRGVLTPSQVTKIYKHNVTKKIKLQQKALEDLKQKHKDSPTVYGDFNDSIIDYKNKGTKGKVNWNALDPNQKNAITLIGTLAVNKGMDVELISDGLERGINGAFEIQGNKILIDIYAGMPSKEAFLDNLIIPTFSHEITHWMKFKSPELYRKYDEYVFGTLTANGKSEMQILNERRLKMEKAHPGVKFTDEEVRDEVIARASEDMFGKSEVIGEFLDTLTTNEKKTLAEKVKEIFQKIKEWLQTYIAKHLSDAAEARAIREQIDRIDGQIKLWDEMLLDSIATNQALKKEGIIAEELVNGISKDGTTIVGKDAIQMSERTYEEGGREFLENWLSNQEGLTKADKEDILRQTDAIKSLMEDIRKNNELPDYARWAAMDVVKDENGEKVLSVIVKNGDYAMNIDFSQVCKKRVALNAVLNAMVQSGDLNAYTLTETDVAELNAIIKKHDFEIACALCFVDSKRYRVGSWAESFCEGADKKKNGKMVHQYGFNEMVRSLIPKGSNIQLDEFNFTNRTIVGQPTTNLLSEMDDSELDFTLIDEILEREFKAGSKPTDLYAYAKAIKDNKELRKILNPAEIISSIGLDRIRLESPELYRLINRHQGTARPKFAHDVVAYGNDVLKASNFTKEKAKMVGGVRCQSFSDFMANMVFDYVQFISELSAKELTAHTYTKEPLFVKLFGLTGMKINMSLVPKAVKMTPKQQEYFAILNDPKANKRSPEYKKAKLDYKKLTENAGLDENGNYIWEDETFPYDVAMDIVVDPRYSANCGTIAVGISDNHITKLLNDDRISMVIPYHKSGLNHIVAMMRNIDLYVDYTKIQNTRFANGKKLEKVPDFDFYGDLYGVDGKEGTHNPKKTAENYLKWCDEHNYIPKFEKSRIGRRFRDNPNYYKLLIDFRVYDTDGTYREQQAVKPIYPAKEEFQDLLLNGVVDKNGKVYGGLKQQQATTNKLDAESEQIVNEFRDKLKEKYGKDVLGVKNSDRDSEGNPLTQEQIDFFRDSKIRDKDGNLLVVRHGTSEDFHVFDFSKAGKNGKAEGAGFYFSDEKEITQRYGDIQKEVYLNITKPMYNNKRTVKKAELVKFVNDLIDFDNNKWGTDWKDSFISNYINTYEFQMSRRYAVQQFVNQIWEYNTNDQDLIFEVAQADGRTYDNSTMKEFYDVLTESIGYDGIIAEWTHSEGKSNVYVTFNSEQSKYTSNKTPTTNLDMRYSDRDNPNIDKYGYNADNVSRANKKGELVNGYYYALTKSEWTTFYDKITKSGYLATANVGVVAPIVVNNKLVIAERLYTGKDAHDYVVTDAYKLFAEDGDNYTLSLLQDALNKGDIDYDTQRIFSFINQLNRLDGRNELLARYNRDNARFDVAITNRKQEKSISGIYGDSKKEIVGEGLSLRDKSSLQTIDERLKRSDRDNVSIYDTLGQTDALIKENAQLKEDVERLKERLKLERQVTNGNYFNENQLDAVAGHLRKISGSTIEKKELIPLLKDVYSYISHSPNLNWQDMFAQCYDIATKMLNKAKPLTETNDYAKMVLRDIRSARISLDEMQIQEARHRFGEKYRNAFMGKVIIANDGVPLDTQWQEWASAYPDFFDASISSTNQISELFDVYDALKRASEVYIEYDESEQTRWLAREIYNQFWNVSPIRTTADKYEKRIKLLNFEHRRTMKEFRDNYEDKLKTQHTADKEKYKALVKDIRDRKNKEIAEVKKLGKERMDAYKENAERKTLIQGITGNALTLNKWLTTNSKDYHIHEAMKGPVIKLLQAIDFSSKQMLDKNVPTKKDISFTEAFADVKAMLLEADNMAEGLQELYGHDLADSIELLVQASYKLVGDNNYVLNQMNLTELQSLDRLVKSIKRVVSQLNKFHTVQHSKGAVNLANTFIEYGDKLGKIKKQDGKIAKFFKFRNTTPYYFFKRLGEAGKKMFEAFQDGWDKLAFNAKSVIDYAEKTYTNKEVVEWGKETKTFTLAQPDGKNRTFEMTTAQIMALHCVSKQDDALRHLLASGMTLSRVDKKGNVIADYENISLTKSDISKILGTLTKRQIEVANKLQEFMNTVCADWGNEISMARFGVKMFTTPDYFPIKVSAHTIPGDNTKEIENASLFRLLNMSFTKSRNKFAEGSIEVGDIFDIFAQHSSDMAKYNALALPVLDFNKFYQQKGKTDGNKEYGVDYTLRTVYGDEAVGYLKRFVRDINGSQNVSRDILGKTFFKNSKVASVANNLRVVLLQPTAYFKASAVMNNKYLVAAPLFSISKLKRSIEKAEKYCGIVQWKALGYYDTDISRGLKEKIKHSNTFKDKAVEFSLKGAEIADKVTFGTLWNACELEIRKTRKDLKVGSDEFYQAVGKRLREIVYATQVVDSTMTRSDMMRSADGWDKMLTTFGSEPIIAYNMLMDTAMQYSLDKKAYGKEEARKKNGKKIRKVIAAYVITNAVAALVESGFDAFREDDEEEEMNIEEFMKIYLKNFAMDLSIGNKLPYVKELYSLMQGYSSSRMDTQWMEYLSSAVTTWGKILSGEGEGKGDKAIKDILKLLSNISGYAFYNIYRDFMATLYKLEILEPEDIDDLFG